MSDELQEIGGFFPLEKGKGEYFSEIRNRGSVYSLNAARYAISIVASAMDLRRIWLPYYLCKTVQDVLEEKNCEIVNYHINDNLEPEVDRIPEGEYIVVVNYFGIQGVSFYERMIDKYKRVIFDNTQAFFAKPIVCEKVFNIYSPRKFIGVSDGAYLICEDNEMIEKAYMKLQEDQSHKRAYYLFDAIENGTNQSYEDSLLAEKDISFSGERRMSRLTASILTNIDYSGIIKKRRDNYSDLLRRIETSSFLPCVKTLKMTEDCVPMVFPLLMRNGAVVRKELVKNHVYIPQWWKWLIEEKAAEISEKENNLCCNLLPLPIDQRYGSSEMSYIVDLLNSIQEMI